MHTMHSLKVEIIINYPKKNCAEIKSQFKNEYQPQHGQRAKTTIEANEQILIEL